MWGVITHEGYLGWGRGLLLNEGGVCLSRDGVYLGRFQEMQPGSHRDRGMWMGGGPALCTSWRLLSSVAWSMCIAVRMGRGCGCAGMIHSR